MSWHTTKSHTFSLAHARNPVISSFRSLSLAHTLSTQHTNANTSANTSANTNAVTYPFSLPVDSTPDFCRGLCNLGITTGYDDDDDKDDGAEW